MTGWLHHADGAGDAPARVVCFAHAGGSARSFLTWQPALTGDAELIAVQPAHPPGGRLSLAGYVAGAVAELRGLAGADPRPIYLFGHSLGGLVAFEAARDLAEERVVAGLVVSALAAPQRLPSPRVRSLAARSGADFARELAFFGGLPADVLADADLMDVLLPGVQADFALAASYRYRPGPPLPHRIVLVAGTEDPHVGPDQLAGWARESVEPPLIHRVPGGHFYFLDDPSRITTVLGGVVRADQHVELI